MSAQYALSERHACGLVGIARSSKRYEGRGRQREKALREGLRKLALERPGFGYRRLAMMLSRGGEKVNQKCVYRLYRAAGLMVRRRRRKRLSRGSAVVATAPQRSNQRWSMDFVSDCVAGGRAIRALKLGRLYAGVPGDRGGHC